MVKRRKFVIGLGALVAGSGAALGTGASVSSTMDRDANVNVVNDANGLLGLVDTTDGAVVREQENGELLIDFTASGNAGGANVDSVYRVGEGQPHQDPAFEIHNHDTVTRTVSISYKADTAGQSTGSTLQFRMNQNKFPDQKNTKVIQVGGGKASNGQTGTATYELPPGKMINVQIVVDSTNGETADDLSGTLTISSN
jgi:hypothetical protein